MSDLLNQASLVMIPSGYKEDTVYSAVPTDGSGDLSFTRSSNGTRINSAGLVEGVSWNLLQYSETFALWNKVQISGNTITVTDNFTTAPNGTLTAAKVVFNTFDATGQIFQNYVLAPTQNLTATLYAKVPSGTKQAYFGFYDGNVKTQLKTLTTEWQRIEYTGSIDASTIRACWFYGGNGESNVEVHLWGGQVNVGSTAQPYFPTTDRLNVPRLTYQNGGGGCPSLLLEKQSTNIALYSEDFSNANWIKGGSTVTANNKISPDGTQNADTVDFSTGGPIEQLILYAADNLTHTVSCWVKVSSGTSSFRLKMTQAGVANHYSQYFTATTTWQRFTFTQAFGSGGTGFYAGVEGTGTILDLWGFQLEPNTSYPTSYIPTTSSSATRVADACYKTGISSLIGQTEGTMFIDFDYLSNSGTNRFSISDGSNANWIFIGTPEDGGTNASRFYIKTNGSVHVDVGSSSYFTFGQRYKLALAYKSGDWAIYGNGTLLYSGTDTIAAVSSPLSVFNFFNASSGSCESGEQINQTALFKTRLTNAELASLTTI